MRKIFLSHLATEEAQAQLEILASLIREGRRVCLLCFEADAAHCHRTLVANALAKKLGVEIIHLAPQSDD